MTPLGRLPRLPRPTPSLFVAAAALVVAAGGAGYAAGQITSAQIKDHTIAAADLARNSVDRTALKDACRKGEVGVVGLCSTTHSSAHRTSYQDAVQDCARQGGRLPSLDELYALAQKSTVKWANGMGNQYEFSSSVSTSSPVELLAMDRSGNLLDGHMASAWHHCVFAP